ncbi:N-6 DNA methylase [uncultured Paracoccus sp.]|uniref:N-6 DNA methylase n=1 Tax=uncultured Paracoccus sp. TaxID=189685 RepID=UPI002606B978|nr:N-6 DNA methylase [uncultured Paracoccus sp.]
MAHPGVTAFLRALDQFDRSKTRTEIFRLFCEIAYCALAKRASPFADQRDRLEADYMACVGRFPNKDDVRRMPEMMATAIEAIAGGGIDFIGQVAAEIGALDAGLGQFFTPYEVSRLMAEISLGDTAGQIEAQGFITVSEPAAGAGGMVLALADALEI